MGEGYSDLCPVILPTFRAFAHAIDIVGGFLAVGAGACHNHVSFLCLVCLAGATIAALMRYKRQARKAGLQGRRSRSS
jgi:hypothetical protein